jgi:hypothetical protein
MAPPVIRKTHQCCISHWLDAAQCFCNRKRVCLSRVAVPDFFSFSRMKDRNFDMPYIMLRGKNFFVTYGWSLNNVCKVLVEHSFVSIRTNQ